MKNTIISIAIAFIAGTSLGYIITPTEVVEEIPESVVETVYEGKCGKAKYCIEVKDNDRTLVFNKGKESEWRSDIPYTESEFSNDDISDLIESIRADKKLKVSKYTIRVNMKARVDMDEMKKEAGKMKLYTDALKEIDELEKELEQYKKRKSNKVTAE
jgi:uncharacterized protein YeeX (DUF496 family)